MQSLNTRGGADHPAEPVGHEHTRPAGRDRMTGSEKRGGATAGARQESATSAEGSLGELMLTRASVAWLALALVGMFVTFTFGLWLAQSAHPKPMSPAHDPVNPPAASAPPHR
jgi:hypothetical protein